MSRLLCDAAPVIGKQAKAERRTSVVTLEATASREASGLLSYATSSCSLCCCCSTPRCRCLSYVWMCFGVAARRLGSRSRNRSSCLLYTSDAADDLLCV